jgi:hypothetical protein
MAAAEEPDVVHRRRAPERLRGPVIELDLVRRPANPASVHRPLAAAAVPLPHRTLHGGGNVARLGGPELPLRLRHEPLSPGALLEQQVEAGAEDLLHRRAGVRVREGVARGVELRDELPGRGGVEPRELGGERLDTVALPVGSWGVHGACGRVGIERFNRRTYGRRRRFTVAGGAPSSRVAAAGRAAGIRTAVTTSRRGVYSTGFSSATSSSASCLERPKNRGSTSAWFSGVEDAMPREIGPASCADGRKVDRARARPRSAA